MKLKMYFLYVKNIIFYYINLYIFSYRRPTDRPTTDDRRPTTDRPTDRATDEPTDRPTDTLEASVWLHDSRLPLW